MHAEDQPGPSSRHAEDQPGPSSRHAEVDASNLVGRGETRTPDAEPVFDVLNTNVAPVIVHSTSAIDNIPQASSANTRVVESNSKFITKFEDQYNITQVAQLYSIKGIFKGFSYRSSPPMSSVYELASLIQTNGGMRLYYGPIQT